MLVLTIRTDKPESEVGLFDDVRKIDGFCWEAHRQLAESLNTKINELLNKNNKKIKDIEGLVVYGGPGSFTGLRIGISTANAISYALSIPVLGVNGEGWDRSGIKQLKQGSSDGIVMPNYGADANITLPRK